MQGDKRGKAPVVADAHSAQIAGIHSVLSKERGARIGARRLSQRIAAHTALVHECIEADERRQRKQKTNLWAVQARGGALPLRHLTRRALDTLQEARLRASRERINAQSQLGMRAQRLRRPRSKPVRARRRRQ